MDATVGVRVGVEGVCVYYWNGIRKIGSTCIAGFLLTCIANACEK